MTDMNKEAISVLNDLIETCKGYCISHASHQLQKN